MSTLTTSLRSRHKFDCGAEVQTAEGKLRLFVGIDRTSEFTFVELHREADKMIAAQFLRNLIAVVPYAIYTVLTDADRW